MRKYLISALVALPLLAVSGHAVAGQPVDNFASDAIVKGDYATAEMRLLDHLAKAPNDQPALLNLAFVYRHTNRQGAANELYRRVLARVDTMVTSNADGSAVWSHELAKTHLTRNMAFASR